MRWISRGTTGRSGTAGNYITVRSAAKWGAKIVGNTDGSASCITADHQYVRFQDFELTGPGGASTGARHGVEVNANNVEVVGCHIHTLCQWSTGGTRRGGREQWRHG